MTAAISVCIIRAQTPFEEVLDLARLSGPSDEDHFRWEMEQYYPNSLGRNPSLNIGIQYGLYDRHELVGVARLKQDDYRFDAVSIEYVAVREFMQKQGFGKRLMNGLFEEISIHWKKKYAIVATTGDPRSFYERIGMKLFGVFRTDENVPYYYFSKLVG